MKITGPHLLKSLKTGAHWRTARNTYGSSHATLVGLLVNWWITLAPDIHFAMESGPCFAHHKGGKGGGICDAILSQHGNAIGIIEVEGVTNHKIGRVLTTIDKIDKFFNFETRLDLLKTLKFGIVLLYAIKPEGPAGQKVVRPIWDEIAIRQKVVEVSQKLANNPLIVLLVDKVQEEGVPAGIRERNIYYKCKVKSITGFLYKNGREVKKWKQ